MGTLTTSLRTDQPNKLGECRIVIVYRNGNETPYKHSIGEKVLPSHFDNDKERVVKHERAKEINYLIESELKALNNIIFDLQRQDIIPSTIRVKNIVRRKKGRKAEESLVNIKPKQFSDARIDNTDIPLPAEAWEEMMVLKKNIVDEVTIGIYRTTLSHLKNYCLLHNRKLNWELFNTDFYNYWTNYFIEDCENQYGDIGLSNNTIGKYFKTLKTFLYWALEKEYHLNLKFKTYKVIQEEIEIFPLTEAHLAQLVAFCDNDANELRLRRVASLFVFLAATGLRYSDGQQLVFGDIYYSGEGDFEQQVLNITTQKTDQILSIPLNIYSIKEITRNALEFEVGKSKIADILVPNSNLFDFSELREYFKDKKDLEKPLLPKISSVKFNKYIKEVGEKCGFNEPIKITRKSGKDKEIKRFYLWEKLSSHDCRRTFITVSLTKGLRPEVVMSITGHSSYKTMLRYNKLTDKVKIEEFQKVWGKTEQRFDDIFGNYRLTIGGVKKASS